METYLTFGQQYTQILATGYATEYMWLNHLAIVTKDLYAYITTLVFSLFKFYFRFSHNFLAD